MAAGKDLGALVGQIGADIRQWEQAAKTIQSDLNSIEGRGQRMSKSLSKSLDQVGRKAERMGRTLSTHVTAPLVGLAGLAVREFGKFDAAMNQSLAIMGDVGAHMEGEMKNAAREIGRTMSLSAEQAAESYFFLASAGLDAEQSVAALPQVAQFAQAGMFDMAQATDLATDAQSALGLTVDDASKNLENMTRVTDVLVKANELANASVEQFSTSLTREAGSALKTFGKDIEEGVAVLAAFADQGIKGERAGMGLSRIIRLMTQAANNNKEAMSELGLEVFDSQGRMRNLADIIGNLEESLGGMTDEQRSAALESIGFTARVQGMILPLLGTSDAIREYESELRNAGGTTKRVSDNQMKAFNEQLGLLWDNVKDVGIAFGETMAPALEKLVTWTQRVVKNFQEMDQETRLRIISMAGMLAASGPLLIAIGKAARIISAFANVVVIKFSLIAGAFALGVTIGQWFVDNWEALMDRAKTATREFFSMKIPEVTFGGILGENLQNNNAALQSFIGRMFGAKEEVEEVAEEVDKAPPKFTSFSESFQNAMSVIGTSIAELSGAGDALEDFYKLFEETPETKGPSTPETPDSGPAKPNVGAIAPDPEVIEIWDELDKTMNSVEPPDFTHRLRATGQSMDELSQRASAMASTLSFGFNQMTGDFMEGVGKIMAGTQSIGGVFNNMLMTLADLAIRVGKIAIGVGVAVEGIKKALQSLNPVAAIAAGGALIALGAWAKSALSSAASNAGSSGGSASTGSGVNVPRTNGYGAADTQQGSAQMTVDSPYETAVKNGNTEMYIVNELSLDGKVVWKNQKSVNHRRKR